MTTNTQLNQKDNFEKDIEDDWDDWGDAEDNHDESGEKTTTKNTEIKLDEKKVPPTEVQAEQKSITVQQQHSSTSSWWGGITSVLSTASEGLGNITSTVSQGLNQVIGVPDPEELARMNAAEAARAQKSPTSTPTTDAAKDVNVDDAEDSAAAFGKNIVSGVTTLGTKVLYTGLDTLEGIGKKTMNILQENDPLLKNKRKILGIDADRPNLSEVLKEAKKDAEEMENTLKALKITQNQERLRFEPLFEQNCGLVHLEALEILSKESALKLQSLVDSVSGKALLDLEETINEVKELMELEELDVESDGDYTAAELNDKLQTAIVDLDLQLQFDEIVNNWQSTLDWLNDYELAETQIIFEQGIIKLAESCALAMNKLHKIAELLLVKDHHSTASEVDGVVQLCHQFSIHLHGVTHRYAAKLTNLNDELAKTKLNILFGDLLVALQQIEKAFKLFLPIIQIGAA